MLRRLLSREIYTVREIDQSVNIPMSLLIAMGLILFGFFVAHRILGAEPGSAFAATNVPVGLAGLLLGAYTVAVRREAVAEMLGLLAIENAAFFAGIAMVPDLPLIAELAAAFDLLLIATVLGVLTRAIGERVGTTEVARLARAPGGPMIVIVLLALPFAAALLSLLPLPRGLAAALTVATTGATVGVAALIVHDVLGAGSVVAAPGWVGVDGLGAVVVALTAFVCATAALYSWGYMRVELHATPRAVRLYYGNFNFFAFSLLAVPVLSEPLLVWIAVELTALSSILLVSFDSTHEALEAAWKYAVLMIMGGLIALLGFLDALLGVRAAGVAPFTWQALVASAPRLAPTPLRIAFLLVLIGFGTKAGFVPLHTWLPDAHSQAPSPVCSILSGIKTATALYVILRLVPIVGATLKANLDHVMVVVGLVSVGVAALLLAQVRDYKRLFAYSTVEHMGIALTAAGLGTASGHFGAAYQIVTHGLTKSFCFLAAGAVLLLAGTREIRDVRGAGAHAPGRRRRVPAGRAGHRRRAAVPGVPERVHDSAGRNRRRTSAIVVAARRSSS